MVLYFSFDTLRIYTAEYLFPIIKSFFGYRILRFESIDYFYTDNYPLNVNLFKLFSPSRRLETSVPHPSDNTRKFFVTFDFVHILKSIRNNWLNQKDIRKTFHFPNFQNIKLDYCVYPVQVIQHLLVMCVSHMLQRKLS